MGFYQSDIVVVPVFGAHGEMANTVDGRAVMAGGGDYEGAPDDAHCKFFDADGMQCKSWAGRGPDGRDGWCAGHRKAAAKRAQ